MLKSMNQLKLIASKTVLKKVIAVVTIASLLFSTTFSYASSHLLCRQLLTTKSKTSQVESPYRKSSNSESTNPLDNIYGVKEGSALNYQSSTRKAEDRIRGTFYLPDFFNVAKEFVQKVMTWPRAKAPEAFASGLPDSVGFVDYKSPNSNAPGSVHTIDTKGAYVFTHKTQLGPELGEVNTTLYINDMTLHRNVHSNMSKSGKKYLLEESDKPVFIHFHGGGTPTATGANALSIGEKLAPYGIAVVGIDLPGHLMGPRNSFAETVEIAKWVMKLSEDLVPPNRKIIWDGHSYGGQITTFAMLYLSQTVTKRVSKYVIMSPAVDSAMGKGTAERNKLDEEVFKEWERYKHKIAPSDITFMANHVLNGKIAIGPVLSTVITSLDYNWSMERIAELKKLGQMPEGIVIMGKYDGLVYVEREQIADTFYTALVGEKNYHLLDKGQTFKTKEGEVEVVGHTIFDLQLDKMDPLVDYVGFKTYNEILKAALGPSEGRAPLFPKADTKQLLMAEYAGSLAFRDYAENYVTVQSRPTEALQEVQQKKQQFERLLKALDKDKNKYNKAIDAKINQESKALAERVGYQSAQVLEAQYNRIKKEGNDLFEKVKVAKDFWVKAKEKWQAFQKEKVFPDYDVWVKMKDEYLQTHNLSIKQVKEHKKAIDSIAQAKRTTEQSQQLAMYNEILAKEPKRSKDYENEKLAMLDSQLSEAGIKRPDFIRSIRDAEFYTTVETNRENIQAMKVAVEELVALKESRPELFEQMKAESYPQKLKEYQAQSGIAFPKSYEGLKLALEQINLIPSRMYVPDVHPRRQKIVELVSSLETFTEKQLEARKTYLYAEKNYQRLRAKWEQAVKSANELLTLVEWDSQKLPGQLKQKRDHLIATLDTYMQKHDVVMDKMTEYLLTFEKVDRTKVREKLYDLDFLQADIDAFMAAQKTFVNEFKALKQEVYTLAANGGFESVNTKMKTIFDSILNQGLNETAVMAAKNSMYETQAEMVKYNRIVEQLKAYIDKEVGVYYETEIITGKDLLNNPNLLSETGLTREQADALNNLWRSWNDLVKPEKTEVEKSTALDTDLGLSKE